MRQTQLRPSLLMVLTGLLFWLPCALEAETTTHSFSFSSPGASALLKLQEAGIAPSVMEAFARAHAAEWKLHEPDLSKLRQLGVPPSVVQAASGVEIGAASGTVPTTLSDQFFRLYFGQLFYQGHIYGIDFGLPLHLRQILQKDPATITPFKAYEQNTLTSQVLSWGGLGLLLAGGIYGVATADPSYNSVNQTISLSAAAVGGLSMIIGVLFHSAAYDSLYQTLLTYNQDLLTKSGGAP